jgi:hypothetical protein
MLPLAGASKRRAAAARWTDTQGDCRNFQFSVYCNIHVVDLGVCDCACRLLACERACVRE